MSPRSRVPKLWRRRLKAICSGAVIVVIVNICLSSVSLSDSNKRPSLPVVYYDALVNPDDQRLQLRRSIVNNAMEAAFYSYIEAEPQNCKDADKKFETALKSLKRDPAETERQMAYERDTAEMLKPYLEALRVACPKTSPRATDSEACQDAIRRSQTFVYTRGKDFTNEEVARENKFRVAVAPVVDAFRKTYEPVRRACRAAHTAQAEARRAKGTALSASQQNRRLEYVARIRETEYPRKHGAAEYAVVAAEAELAAERWNCARFPPCFIGALETRVRTAKRRVAAVRHELARAQNQAMSARHNEDQAQRAWTNAEEVARVARSNADKALIEATTNMRQAADELRLDLSKVAE